VFAQARIDAGSSGNERCKGEDKEKSGCEELHDYWSENEGVKSMKLGGTCLEICTSFILFQ